MSVPATVRVRTTLGDALDQIAAAAGARDCAPEPSFPEAPIALLEASGALAWNATLGTVRPPAGEELELVRSVARADAGVGRIVDGHLNAVERLVVHGPAPLRERELAEVRAGRLRAGVWGGDPRPDEGFPATIERRGGADVLSGVKTFCSGAGGLDRALVLARDPGAARPAAVWIDLTDRASVIVDEGWYRSAGLRSSVSHRVMFDGAPVLARFGPPGSLSEEPWFSRDALRTAASWVGMADAALAAALAELRARPARGPLEELAAGRMLTAQHTITASIERGARAMDNPSPELPAIALHTRAAIATACGTLLEEAARACGSHPFATGGALDRARRDLELFLLQHRLDPSLAAVGAGVLDAPAEANG